MIMWCPLMLSGWIASHTALSLARFGPPWNPGRPCYYTDMAGKAAGYNLLALIMGAQPDFAIFRRFLAPNARKLLRLQGEIINLDAQLGALICADRNSDDAEKRKF